MARSDLLKKLFRGYKARNDTAFLEAARAIVDDERKKHHNSLASELARILDNGTSPHLNGHACTFDPVPRDADRGAPLIEIHEPDRNLDDLVLSSGQLGILRTVIEEVRQWDVLEANGLRPAHKLLFCGPPGCGKSATADALAAEWGIPVLHVRFDAVVSSLLGETAANLRKVFEYASRGMWVLLFDEFDAIGRSRDDATEHGELKRVVNAFLQMLDRFTGRSVIIAATNFEQSLDPALWRRFDEIIRYERPDREQILALLRKRLAIAKADCSLLKMAQAPLAGMSHAEIERVCFDALKQMTLEGARSLSDAIFSAAVDRQRCRRQALEKSRPKGAPTVEDA